MRKKGLKSHVQVTAEWIKLHNDDLVNLHSLYFITYHILSSLPCSNSKLISETITFTWLLSLLGWGIDPLQGFYYTGQYNTENLSHISIPRAGLQAIPGGPVPYALCNKYTLPNIN